jgi:REP element-mobilizing transposase RayT
MALDTTNQSGSPDSSEPLDHPNLQSRDGSATLQSGSGVPPLNYFNPEAPIALLSGDLPHWRQEGTTYFVTFRVADSLPREKLQQWREELRQWTTAHPEPYDARTRREYYELFPQRLQQWLDAGSGSCLLLVPEFKNLVEAALRHFDNQRYHLRDFVVAPNHVHALVSPTGGHTLSKILHSWKSFTAHEILSMIKSGNATAASPVENNAVWQSESFDHIVRSAASMEKFRAYIRNHKRAK